MTHARSRTRFPQETKPRSLVTKIFFADEFESHGAMQIDVKRLVGHTHRTPAQFHRSAIFARHQLVMFQALRCVLRSRIASILGKRLTGLSAGERGNRIELGDPGYMIFDPSWRTVVWKGSEVLALSGPARRCRIRS